jgi:hypothetical protein
VEKALARMEEVMMEEMMVEEIKLEDELWRTPSQVRPKMGLGFLQRNCGDWRARSQLSALKGVERRAEAPGWD